MNCQSKKKKKSNGRSKQKWIYVFIYLQICNKGNASESNQLMQWPTAAGDVVSEKQKLLFMKNGVIWKKSEDELLMQKHK